MKRITKLRIENYKAYIRSTEIDLPQGKNLLLYGENGSGKSSLYKALYHFMVSSVDPTRSFDKNFYSGVVDGLIEVSCSDYDNATKTVIPGTEVILTSSNNPALATNNVGLVNTGFRVSGFLDYSTLLKVYLNKGVRPNLFMLLMELLSEYIGTKYGFTETLGNMISGVNKNIVKAYHRTDHIYTQNKAIFDRLSAAFPQIINDINADFSAYMRTYFDDFNLDISLIGASMRLHDTGHVYETHIEGDVYLDVRHYGQPMVNYNYTLNEARLSAIAICLYLASLKLRASITDFRVLYLDDVFVGLDNSNRKPVLRIINDHFSDYQILISTYDKSWYLMAKEFFNDETQWEYKELYEGVCSVGGTLLPHPLVINGDSDIEKARKYLYDPVHPDYPAAANYMRKAFEGLFANHFYRPSLLNNNLEPIEAYRLTTVLRMATKFCKLLKNEPYSSLIVAELNNLRSCLKPMLHPLSHYAPDEPVYKHELIEGEQLFDRIAQLLKSANYPNRCKIVVMRGGKLQFRVEGASGWKLIYILTIDDNLYSYEDNTGQRCITNTTVHVTRIEEYQAGVLVNHMNVSKNSRNYKLLSYSSVSECFSKLSSHIVAPAGENKPDAIFKPIFEMFFREDVINKKKTKINYKNNLKKVM